MPAVTSHRDEARRDLLPDALGSGLKGWLRRGNGLLLLGFAALGWLGLLSWQLPGSGPSGGPEPHLLARLSGATADFLLQSFGVAAAVLFAVPTFWGVEQLVGRRLGKPWLRVLIWPTAALTAAGALSALPAPGSWPFGRGLGGVVGDQLCAFVAIVIAKFGSAAPGPLAGLGLGLLAVALFTAATTAYGSASPEAVAQARGPRHASEVSLELPTRRRPKADDLGPSLRWDGDENDDPPAFGEPRLESPLDTERPGPARSVRMTPSKEGRPPVFARVDEEPAEVADDDHEQPTLLLHVPYDDLPEDNESRDIAKRFAPPGAKPLADATARPVEVQPRAAWKQLLGRPAAAPAARTRPASAHAKPPVFEPVPTEELTPGRAPLDPAAVASIRTWPESASAYRVPPVSLLSRLPAQGEAVVVDNTDLIARARRLEAALAEFGVRSKIIGVVPGPTVAQFEIELAPGTKASRVIGLAEDVSRALGVKSARIVSLPGRASLIVELPNDRQGQVVLRDLLESKAYRKTLSALPLAVGVAADRQPIVTDLAMLSGVLVAGKRGAGKSTALNAIMTSMLLRFAPSDVRLLVIDPKGVDHAAFEGAAHLLAPVIVDAAPALAALQWCAAEMDERLKAMAKLNLRGIGTYNNAVRNALRQGTAFKRAVQTGFDGQTGRAVYEEEIITPKAMPYIVVAIDDLDVLTQDGGEALDQAFQRLAQGGRNAGIHIVAATTRLDGDGLSPGARAALPARICFKLDSKGDSRTAIGGAGAELLLSAGDFLFSVGGSPVRGQAPVLADGDIATVVEAVRRQAQPSYEPAIAGARGWQLAEPDTEIYQRAVSLAMAQGSTSVADLRARLGLAYGLADDLVRRMESAGLVGEEDGSAGRRRVLLGRAASA